MVKISLKDTEVFAYVDPAAGKHALNRKRSARQALVVGARDYLSRWFLLYEWAGKETATELLERVLTVYERFRPCRLGIESNGMQVLFGALVRDAAISRFGPEVRIVPVFPPTKVSKEYRIRTGLQPVILQGRLFLTDITGPTAVEIRGFPTAATKDLVDAVESMIRMAPKRAQTVQRNAEVDDYASYLRNTGCSPQLIKHKIQQFIAEQQYQPEESENAQT